MNLLYLSHISCLRVENDIPMLESHGYKVTLLNSHKVHFKKRLDVHPSFTDIINLYEPKFSWINKIKSVIGNLVKYILATTKLDALPVVTSLREKWDAFTFTNIGIKYKNRILNILKEKNIDIIYVAWGTTVFPEIKVIQESKMNIPIILSIQSYPLRESRVSNDLKEEDIATKMIFEKLDGRIHCSQTMYDYMKSHFNVNAHGKDLIAMGYYRKDYFFTKRLDLLSKKDNEPHIVFIGDVNFSQRTFNDIRRQIAEITAEGIHIHFAHTNDKIKGDPNYIHMFKHKQLANGELATFMTQFDACIVLYNTVKKYIRYQISLPERFLFALNAAIPIVVPKGYFVACEEVIYKYKIGFAYEKLEELKNNLKNREIMGAFQNNAINISEELTFENNFETLDRFIIDVKNQFCKR